MIKSKELVNNIFGLESMHGRRFAGIFFAIFILGALPLFLMQPAGGNGVSLGIGFSMPLHSMYSILLVLVGIWAALLQGVSTIMLTVTFALMLAVAGMLAIGGGNAPGIEIFIFGAIFLFALSFSMVPTRRFLFSAVITSSCAYHMGQYYMVAAPADVIGLHYLVGALFSSLLMLLIGVAMGLTLTDPLKRKLEPYAARPVFAAWIKFFR